MMKIYHIDDYRGSTFETEYHELDSFAFELAEIIQKHLRKNKVTVMINEVVGYVSVDSVSEDVFIFYNVILKQDIDKKLKTGAYFEFANWNGETGILELLDADGKILHTIVFRLEIESVQHH